MKSLKTLPVALALLIAQLAVAQQNNLISHLPENSSMVISMNLFRIGTKIPKDSLLNSPLMQKNDKESPLVIMNKLTTSGISLGQDILIAMVPDTAEAGRKPAMHVLGKLSDAGLFSKMLQDIFPNDTQHTYGIDHILTTKGGIFGWNNDMFVFSSVSSRQRDIETSFFGMADTTANGNPAPSADQLMFEIKKQQREQCFHLLDGPVPNGLSDDPRFIAHINTPGDLKMWNNGMMNPLMANISPVAGLMKMGPGNARVKSSVTNFENGRVVSESRMYLDPATAAQLKDQVPTPQSTELIRKLPEGNPLLIMNMSYNKTAARNLKQPEQVKMIMDSLKKILPFEWDKLTDVFGNNMMLAVTTDKDPDPSQAKNPFNGMHLYVAMPIVNKANFDQLAQVVNKTLDSLRQTEEAGKMLKNFNPFTKASNDLFVLGLREADVTAYMNQAPSGSVPDWFTEQAAHPMSMQFDFKQLVRMIMSASKSRNSEAQMAMFNSFRDIVMTGGDIDQGAVKMRMEYRFTDTEKNSLLQLFNLIGKMAADKPVRDADVVPPVQDEEVKLPPPPPPPKQKAKTTVKGKTKTKQ